MKKLLIIIFLAGTVPAFSQAITSLEYSMGFATGDLADYIGAASFRGFTTSFRKLVQPNVAAGVEFGWNVFYDEKPSAVYTQGNFSYSGKQYRYNNQFPMLVRGDYYLKPGERINPYVGLGLGTMYTLRNTDMGQYRFEEDAWHFLMKPEVGVEIDMNPGFAFTLSGKYYTGFAAGGMETQGYFTINVGAVFKP
jgi:opacity protein-like surface antigen